MITYQPNIICDGEDCDNRDAFIEGDPVEMILIPSELKLMTEGECFEGWSVEGDKHFCPTCTEKRKKSK